MTRFVVLVVYWPFIKLLVYTFVSKPCIMTPSNLWDNLATPKKYKQKYMIPNSFATDKIFRTLHTAICDSYYEFCYLAVLRR